MIGVAQSTGLMNLLIFERGLDVGYVLGGNDVAQLG